MNFVASLPVRKQVLMESRTRVQKQAELGRGTRINARTLSQ